MTSTPTQPLTDEQLADWHERYRKIVLSPHSALLDNIPALIAEVRRLREPSLARNQPCGCVICICADPVKCHGCGALECGTHPVGEIPDPVYEPHPLHARISSLECQVVTIRDALGEANIALNAVNRIENPYPVPESAFVSGVIEQLESALSSSSDYAGKIVIDKTWLHEWQQEKARSGEMVSDSLRKGMDG